MNFREYNNAEEGSYDVLMDCSSDEIVSLIHAYGLDHTYGELTDGRYWFLLNTGKKSITPCNDIQKEVEGHLNGKELKMDFHAKDWQFEQYSDYEQQHHLSYRMESADTAQYLTAAK